MARTIGIAILAAGLSRRFGAEDKLMAPLERRPLCDHIARSAAALDVEHRFSICTPGSGPAAVFAAYGFQIIENLSPEGGLSSSVKLAARNAMDTGLDGLVLCLADMPFVSVVHLELLCGRWLQGGCPPAIASRAAGAGGERTPPIIFSSAVFPDLLAISGDSGARALIAGAEALEFDEASLVDFDTIADFDRAGGTIKCQAKPKSG